MNKLKLSLLVPLFGILLKALKPEMVRALFTDARQWLADRAAATGTDYDDQLLALFTANPEILKALGDFLLDRIEDLIAATPTPLDDQLIGPVIVTIRDALHIPDND